MADLPAMPPGARFMLSTRDGRVAYRGTVLDDGRAELDVMDFRGIDPIVVDAQAVRDMYDPDIHTLDTIGTAV